MDIECRRPWLVARFAAARRMVSWSLNRPGFVDADTVAWREVRGSDLAVDVDPAAWFEQRLAQASLGDAVGMMTSRNVASFVRRSARVEDVEADCVVTLGLNNGEPVGSRQKSPVYAPGTINILCHVSLPLSDAALLEASSIVAQARTVAVLEAGYRRKPGDEPVSGTGTDCVVMAAPTGPGAAPYAGMHTPIGEAVGACVLSATRLAVAEWLAERRG